MKPDSVKYLRPDEFRRLLGAASQVGRVYLRERNYLLFCLAGNLGLRVSEVTALRVRDVFLKAERAFIRIDTRKRRRPETHDLPLDPKLVKVLRSYIAGLPDAARVTVGESDVKGREQELCLFPGANPFKPMATRNAERIFKDTAKLAGIDPLVSFHALRHYRGCQVWQTTRDIVAVRKFLRHGAVSSSMVYVHMDEEQEAAINKRVGAIV